MPSSLPIHLRLLLCCLCFTHAASSALAQQDAPPPAPPDFILDDARVVSDDVRAALSAEIKEFHAATGCQLFVATTTFLQNTTARDRADKLNEAWIKGGPGVVIVYDRASAAHAVSPTDGMWARYPTPSLVETFREITNKLREENAKIAESLPQTTRLLMSRVVQMEKIQQRQNQILVPGRERWLAILFVVALSFGIFALSFIKERVRKNDAIKAVQFFFPEVEAVKRYGAQYGGGVIAELSFEKK